MSKLPELPVPDFTQVIPQSPDEHGCVGKVTVYYTADQMRDYALAALAQRDDVIRCSVTGNESGSDTWMAGWTCPCAHCTKWLAQRDAAPARIMVDNLSPSLRLFSTQRKGGIAMTYDRLLIARMLRKPGCFKHEVMREQADLLDAAENACDIQTASDKLAKLKELSERADAAEQTFAVKWMRANTINIQSSELAPVEFQAACVAYVRDQFAGVN